jgi:hypothetical protein
MFDQSEGTLLKRPLEKADCGSMLPPKMTTTTEIDEITSKSDSANLVGKVFVGGYLAIFGWVK